MTVVVVTYKSALGLVFERGTVELGRFEFESDAHFVRRVRVAWDKMLQPIQKEKGIFGVRLITQTTPRQADWEEAVHRHLGAFLLSHFENYVPDVQTLAQAVSVRSKGPFRW